MKILYFVESLEAGGKERRLVELICYLTKNKSAECEIVLFRNQIHYKRIFEAGVKIHILPRTHKFGFLLFFRFLHLVRTIKPNLIHVWGSLATFYAIPTKVLLRIPLVNSQITDVPIRLRNPFLNWCNFLFSDLILANSNAGLKRYNVLTTRGQVIYNGFDFDRIAKLTDAKTLRIQYGIETRFVVGMVASFSDTKDYLTYITTAVNILSIRNDITFFCIGSGENSAFQNLVPPSVKTRVRFLGAQHEVESLMNLCDIGVLTSYGEGISNALLEFMALGKPVVATNLGGTPELVENSVNGFLIGVSDSDGLFNSVNSLLENDERRLKMGEMNRKKVKSRFSISNMGEEFMVAYKSLV